MEPINHDPTTKLQIRKAIYEILYPPLNAILKEKIDTIIIRNSLLGKFRSKSFIFRNEIYALEDEPIPRKMNSLMPELRPEMLQYLQEVDHLNKYELPRVLGYITQVLNASNNLHDYLKLLPEGLHEPIKYLIDTNAYRTDHLDEQTIQNLKDKNKEAIQLIRQRVALNLIL